MKIKTGDIFQAVSTRAKFLHCDLGFGDLIHVTETNDNAASIHIFDAEFARATPWDTVTNYAVGPKTRQVAPLEKFNQCLNADCLKFLGHAEEAVAFSPNTNIQFLNVIHDVPNKKQLTELNWAVDTLDQKDRKHIPKGFLPFKIIKPKVGTVMIHKIHGPVFLLEAVLDFICRYEERFLETRAVVNVLESGFFYNPCDHCEYISKKCDREISQGKFCPFVIDPLPLIRRVEEIINNTKYVKQGYKKKHRII